MRRDNQHYRSETDCLSRAKTAILSVRREDSMTPAINLRNYPLSDAARRATILHDAKKTLARDGMVTLDDFMTPEAVAKTLRIAKPAFETDSFEHRREHNIYFSSQIDGITPDHPALATLQTANRTLCADQLGATPLMALYEDSDFVSFLADLMGKPMLYTMDDPLARVNAMTYRPGEALNWHFDRSEFTTTILLEAPDAGGEFEYRPALRTAENANYDGVAKLLKGKDRQVRSIALKPGALNVFKGRNTAHRVTPPMGDKPRTIAVLSYYETPGVRFSAEERIGFYGRS